MLVESMMSPHVMAKTGPQLDLLVAEVTLVQPLPTDGRQFHPLSFDAFVGGGQSTEVPAFHWKPLSQTQARVVIGKEESSRRSLCWSHDLMMSAERNER